MTWRPSSGRPSRPLPTRLESAQPAADDLDLSAAEAVPVDEDDDFFDEQSLSDELDQALEAPEADEPPEPPEPPAEEAELPPEPEPAAEEPPSEEQPAAPPEPAAESAESEESEEEAEEAPGGGAFYDQEHEDVLEETPEFLQDTPEHDRLWFEQKPPKDFDFDE
jgi:hypothetical protein